MKISQAYESYLDHIETLNKMIPSLVPSIFWAKTGGRHLIVSTNVGMIFDRIP